MADDKRTARLAEPEADARAKADGRTVAEGSADAAVTPDDLASLSVEFESAINPTPATRFEKPDMLPFSDEIRTPKSEVTKGRIDDAYFDAGLKVVGALRLIDELEPSQREVWDSYQLTLADSRHNPEKYKSMLDNRNQSFPEIGKYLEQAYKHQLTAEKMVGEFNRKEFLNYIEKQYGEGAASSAKNYLQTSNYSRASNHKLVDTVDGGSLDIVFDIQTDKPNVPNYYSRSATQFRVERFGAEQVGVGRIGNERFGAEQVGVRRIRNERFGAEQVGVGRIGNEPFGIELDGFGRVRTERVGTERFGIERTNRPGPFRSGGELLSPGWDYRETARLDAASSVLTNPLLLRDGAVSAHNNYFNDQRFSRANLFASQRVPENLSAQLASFITRPDLAPSAKYDSLSRDSVKRDLDSIDHPRYAETARIRALRFVELTKEIVPADRTMRDVNAVLLNPRASDESKHNFFKDLDRLAFHQGEGRAFAAPADRLVVAAQLLSAAANITEVDQGDFGVCGLLSIEKRILARRPDVLAKMLADVALTGRTTTQSSRTIEVEADWLRPQTPDADSFPVKDDVRSLASQWTSLVLANIRFDIYNEAHGTKLRYAHERGLDRVLDYSKENPGIVYSARFTGNPSLEPNQTFEDGTVIVDSNLRPLENSLADSPIVDATVVLDVLEDVLGEDPRGSVMMNYKLARIAGDNFSVQSWGNWLYQTEQLSDKRVSVFRNQSELKSNLTDTARSDNFPLIFLSPRHAATVDIYDTQRGISLYDNQWGKDEDAVKSDGQLFDTSIRGFRKDMPIAEREMMLRPLRAEYERWCTKNGVIPDTRYPSEAELIIWKNSW